MEADKIDTSAPVQQTNDTTSFPKVAVLLAVIVLIVVVFRRRGWNTLRSKSVDEKTMV